MPLKHLELLLDDKPVPGNVRSFLRIAEQRIERLQRSRHIPGFVPSDFHRTYRVLRALSSADLAPGPLFCEWGSGFGVVACLAALLDFDASGIEIEGELVDAARQLADDFGLSVEFVRGSFIPRSDKISLGAGNEFAWLNTDEGSTEEELGFAPHDHDVIFAYPWPDEEKAIERLFERYAARGSILVSHHGGEDFRIQRKIGTKRSRQSKR